jgi:hypothetical protein
VQTQYSVRLGRVCFCRVAQVSTAALAAYLRFLIMSSFLMRADAVRLCKYYVPSLRRVCCSYLHVLPSSSSALLHRACLSLLRCSPIFHFCCSPIFHFCYSPAFQAIRFSLRS